MNEQIEIQKSYRQRQEKYVYYIIALCVAATAFSVQITLNKPLSISQVPLGIAVLFWAISIFCGLKFLAYSMSIMYANNELFKIINRQDEYQQKDQSYLTSAFEGVKLAIESNGKVASRYFKVQRYGFYAGFLSFLFWHIVEMYLQK